MLNKVNETIVLVISTIFVLAGLWNFSIPVSEVLLTDSLLMLTAFLSALGLFGLGAGTVLKVQKSESQEATESKK